MPLSFESATLNSWLLFVVLQAVDEGNMQMISVQKEESQDAGCRCATNKSTMPASIVLPRWTLRNGLSRARLLPHSLSSLVDLRCLMITTKCLAPRRAEIHKQCEQRSTKSGTRSMDCVVTIAYSNAVPLLLFCS